MLNWEIRRFLSSTRRKRSAYFPETDEKFMEKVEEKVIMEIFNNLIFLKVHEKFENFKTFFEFFEKFRNYVKF